MHVGKPQGEMMIYLSNGDKHALLLDVIVTKDGDIYIGAAHLRGFKKELLRQSWHASGKGHIYTPAGRVLHRPKEPPGQLREPRYLFSCSSPDPGMLRWDYSPKERPRRLNFSITPDLLSGLQGWWIEIWALPSTANERDVLKRGQAVLARAVMHWTRPVVMAVLWTLTPEAWEALVRQIQEDSRRGP